MATYKTPGVYIQEISKLPASVAQVETAIPAFIGYTERAVGPTGQSLVDKPVKIGSMVDYEAYYGGSASYTLTQVILSSQGTVVSSDIDLDFFTYDSVRLFYENGGGDAYIVSLGDYDSTPSVADFTDALQALRREDEPTLILTPDVLKLTDTEQNEVQQAALKHCSEMQDRFAIIDLREEDGWEDGVDDFRDNIGLNYLSYGAAYTPHVYMLGGLDLSYRDIKDNIQTAGGSPIDFKSFAGGNSGLEDLVDALEAASDDRNTLDSELDDFFTSLTYSASDDLLDSLRKAYQAQRQDFQVKYATGTLNTASASFRAVLAFLYGLSGAHIDDWIKTASPDLDSSALLDYARDLATDFAEGDGGALVEIMVGLDQRGATSATPSFIASYTTAEAVAGGNTWVFEVDATDHWGGIWNAATVPVPGGDDDLPYYNSGVTSERKENMAHVLTYADEVFEYLMEMVEDIFAFAEKLNDDYESSLKQNLPAFGNMFEYLEKQIAILPPSGIVAGVYSYVDSTRGVWKAPANVSITGVEGLTESIDAEEQEDLNVDVTGGKSINAIRQFPGRGRLIWGARTLAGNDNEWRYVSVRRFFIMVEESVKKATEPFVFESNDANTWGKIRGMISNYLTGLWRDGALAGAKPDQAFFVNCGLGETMTSQDILEGRLIVEVGMAAVRPAEFIILQFMHKVQEA